MDLRPRTTRVKLSPTPGYCIKSTALQDGACRVTQDTASGADNGVANASTNSIILGGPQSAPPLGTLKVPRGIKIFVNICWDVNVPPPPEGNEEMIQRAMRGEEELDDETLLQGGGWFVPVVVSQPRQDLDKGMLILRIPHASNVRLCSSRYFRPSLKADYFLPLTPITLGPTILRCALPHSDSFRCGHCVTKCDLFLCPDYRLLIYARPDDPFSISDSQLGSLLSFSIAFTTLRSSLVF